MSAAPPQAFPQTVEVMQELRGRLPAEFPRQAGHDVWAELRAVLENARETLLRNALARDGA
jgi:hypothetical protein